MKENKMVKTCSKCGFVGDEKFFKKGENVCKKCMNEYEKQRVKDKENAIENKTCSKCGFIGKKKLFGKGGNICKKCQKKLSKQRIKDQQGIIKTCIKCEFVGKDDLFVTGCNTCKECAKKENKQRRNNRRIKNQEGEQKTCDKCGFIGSDIFFAKGTNICKKCKGTDKICSKCGFIGNEGLFEKGSNLCKKCKKENRKQRIKNQEGKEKICSKCNFVGPENLFKKGSNVCNECNREYCREADRNRYKNNPFYKLIKLCSKSVNKMLKSQGSSKNGESSKVLFPFIQEELIIHIEKQFSLPENLDKNGKVWMTWNNQGKYNPKTWDDNDPSTWVWNLDHIIPQSKLPYSSMDDENFRLCWTLSNLHPYSAKQNILDGNRR